MGGWLKRLKKRLDDLVREIDRLLQPEPELVPVRVPVRSRHSQEQPRR